MNTQDTNEDGSITIQELISWIEVNQLVKFVEEGRDADMDRIIEKKAASENTDQKDGASTSSSPAPTDAVKSDK